MTNIFETQEYIRQYMNESVNLAKEINCFLESIGEVNSVTLVRINMLKEKADRLIRNVDATDIPEESKSQITAPITNELILLTNLEKTANNLETEKEKSKSIEQFQKITKFRKEIKKI